MSVSLRRTATDLQPSLELAKEEQSAATVSVEKLAINLQSSSFSRDTEEVEDIAIYDPFTEIVLYRLAVAEGLDLIPEEYPNLTAAQLLEITRIHVGETPLAMLDREQLLRIVLYLYSTMQDTLERLAKAFPPPFIEISRD